MNPLKPLVTWTKVRVQRFQLQHMLEWRNKGGATLMCSKTCYDSQVTTAWKLKVGAHNREASRGVKLMFDGAFTAGEVSFT